MSNTLKLSFDHEFMSAVFSKYHVRGLPTNLVLHEFQDIDRGDPHDHPWGFHSMVLCGGYVERVFQLDGSSEVVEHLPGESFYIPATHIHRIEKLLGDTCWTVVLPGRHERTSGFWQFREDGVYWRAWNGEWERHI